MNKKKLYKLIDRVVSQAIWNGDKLDGDKKINVAVDELKAAVPVWHPYPQEKPPKTGWYLTDYDTGMVETNIYQDGKFIYEDHVTAWMPLPEPYSQESEE